MLFGPSKSPFEIKPVYKKRASAAKKPSQDGLGVSSSVVFRYSAIAVITVLLSTLVYFQEQTGEWFKASVLETPLPFNGTVMPVEKVPNWTTWGGNASTNYSQVSADKLIPLPPYDLGKMAFPNENLIWGNADHDVIRNMKITYPVVYLGDYELDHKEGEGSHLAVDIKMPIGTPVRSIANGRVVKVSMTNDGFGHHVVIEHQNVPDPKSPGAKTTLYSGFNHMDQISVKEGQNVLKGQQIGTSGNTGTSTTPHLHFQIDRVDAPWHPYWPFSWAESQAAGMSFFDAVTAGLGIENAKKYTINPMTYVTANLNYSNVASAGGGSANPNSGGGDNSGDTTDTEEVESTDNQTQNPGTSDDGVNVPVDNTPPVEVVENPLEEQKTDTSLFTFRLSGDSVSLLNNGITITAEAFPAELERMSASDEIRVELSGVGRLIKKSYTKSDFVNGAIKIIVNSSDMGTANVLIGKSSHQVKFIDKVEGIAKLRIDHDGAYQKNRVETIAVLAVDVDGNLAPAVSFSGVISLTAKEGSAEFNPKTLSPSDFRNGKATVRVTVPNENRLVIRAQNGAIVGESDPLKAESSKAFADVSPAHPHYNAIQYLYNASIVGGYDDGTFKPERTVNRAEALKMLMGAFNVESGAAAKLEFNDTDEGAWYAPYLATAVRREIVAGYDDGSFRPGNTVNKAEYLKILFRTNDIEGTDTITANPYADVPKDAWYAPYAYLLNRKNLLDVDNNRLDPANGMTRGEVAETIYRLKHILDSNQLTYSK